MVSFKSSKHHFAIGLNRVVRSRQTQTDENRNRYQHPVHAKYDSFITLSAVPWTIPKWREEQNKLCDRGQNNITTFCSQSNFRQKEDIWHMPIFFPEYFQRRNFRTGFAMAVLNYIWKHWETRGELIVCVTAIENSWTCRSKLEMTEQIRLAGKATLTSGLHLGRSEVLRSLRHYLRAQIQGHHTIDHLAERGVERWSAKRSSLTGLGFSERIDPSCIELNWFTAFLLGGSDPRSVAELFGY